MGLGTGRLELLKKGSKMISKEMEVGKFLYLGRP